MRISAIFWCSMLAIWSFTAGNYVHEYRHGSVQIYHGVDEGTDLNHGQVYVDFNFPHGIAFLALKFPGGHYWPDDSKPRWVEVLPDGRQKVWIDHFQVEAIDQLAPEFQ